MKTTQKDDPPVARLIRLPVQARRMPFGNWIWFITDADGKNIAQIMPSTDEARCRELVELINLGAQRRDEETTKPSAVDSTALLSLSEASP